MIKYPHIIKYQSNSDINDNATFIVYREDYAVVVEAGYNRFYKSQIIPVNLNFLNVDELEVITEEEIVSSYIDKLKEFYLNKILPFEDKYVSKSWIDKNIISYNVD